MKTKLLLTIIFLSFCGATSLYAQTIVPDTLREGNLVYLKKDNYIWKMGTEKLTGKSYANSYPELSFAHSNAVIKPIYQAVFSQERAKELSLSALGCNIYYSSVEKKVVKIRFWWSRQKESPIKLSELDKLEKLFRSTPNLIPEIKPTDRIIDEPMFFSASVKFKKLYD